MDFLPLLSWISKKLNNQIITTAPPFLRHEYKYTTNQFPTLTYSNQQGVQWLVKEVKKGVKLLCFQLFFSFFFLFLF